MDRRNSIEIAQSLIQRYGNQAQAVAEEQAATISQEDSRLRHVWEQVPGVVAELRRAKAAKERDASKAKS